MKLYLSSIRVPNLEALYTLLGKRDHIKIASIRTAWDTYPSEKRSQWGKETQKMFEQMRGEAEVIDLKPYQEKSNELLHKLGPFDLVWLHGGNSFYLNYWASQCNLKDVLTSLLNQGMVYAGDSAGAVLAGPSFHGIQFADDPSDAPQTIFEALHLIDFMVIPHWGNPQFQEVLEQVKVKAEQYNKVVTIGDAECLTVDGDKVLRHPGDKVAYN